MQQRGRTASCPAVILLAASLHKAMPKVQTCPCSPPAHRWRVVDVINREEPAHADTEALTTSVTLSVKAGGDVVNLWLVPVVQ